MATDDKALDHFSGYLLRTLRLINFHNFVDETIAMQGSLFLMGNNGTGKTTIIDAIQLVLTGGQQLTYNAATVMGARAESGRTLAGVILRHDFESGKIGRESGAIGYAVLELQHVKTQQTLTLGVGAFVQGLDQRPELWGFVVDDALAEIPLTVRAAATDAAAHYRPVDKRELIELVGKAHVYDIGRYRTQVGNRLFGGRENFERFADLLKASKSYKELVVKARDFEGLFALLLPAPDHQVFQDIETTLQSLEKIEVDLKALHQEKDLLEEAMAVLDRVACAREAIERYKYIQIRFSFENVDREATQIQRAIHRNEEAIAESRTRLETVLPQVERTRAVLNELRIGEPARLLEEMERLELERRRAQQELTTRTAEIEAETSKEKTLARDAKRARADFDEALQEMLKALDRITWPASVPASMLTAADGALAALKESCRAVSLDAALNTNELRRLQNVVLRELDAVRARLREQQQPLLLRKAEFARATTALEAETIGAGHAVEFLPSVPGYADFAAELDSKNIEWSPLYRLIDTRENAPAGFADVLEACLGEAFLGAVFVAPEQLEAVVAIACARYPCITIADTAALEKLAPSAPAKNSICALLDAGGNERVSRFLEANVGAVTLADVAGNARGEQWLALDGVAYTGRAYRKLALPTRGLLGSTRRHAAIAVQLNERRARLAELGTQSQDVTAHLAGLHDAEQAFSAVRGAIEERVLPWLLAHRLQQHQNAAQQTQEIKERITRVKAAAARITKLCEQLTQQIESIRANKSAQTTGDISKQIDTLKKQLRELERERDQHQELIARHTERLDVARRQVQELDGRRGQLQEQLAAQRAALQAKVAPQHKEDLNHYVDVVCDGRGLRPAQLNELVREQERAINREIGSLVGLEDKTHQGRGGLLHHELLWAKYAFVYNEVRNELRDQNNEMAAALLDRLVTEVEKLESAVSERRRKLLEKTILGDLSNQYTRDLYRLRESLNAVNLMLEGLTFGRAQYKFTQKIKPEYRQVYGIVRRAGAIDPESQHQLKIFFESRLEQLRLQPDGTLPKFLDYRHWFDYQLHVKTVGAENGIELTNDIRRLGSGGEQAVPNYLLIMAMGALLFNQIGSKVRTLLFDEAFYGIDSARRDELLRFASRLGIALVVATPEMDGVTEAMRSSTTLLLEKNDQNEVFIGNFAWESKDGVQLDIFTQKAGTDAFTVTTAS